MKPVHQPKDSYDSLLKCSILDNAERGIKSTNQEAARHSWMDERTDEQTDRRTDGHADELHFYMR